MMSIRVPRPTLALIWDVRYGRVLRRVLTYIRQFAGPDLEGGSMCGCWEVVRLASGSLWQHFVECRLGLSRKEAAQFLGFASGALLDRHLRDTGLPPFQMLRNWVYVVLLVEWNAAGVSIAHWVLRRNGDPAVYYRFVPRVTTCSWTEVSGSW